MLDYFDWQVLKTVNELKNITNSAKVLYVSQPALTERIKKIEKELGVKIVNTSNKGVTFTRMGEFVAEFAKKSILDYAVFRDRLSNLGNDVSGVLRIGSPSIIARFYLPLLIQNFKMQYPAVKFEITIENSSEVLAHMKDGTFHFGFLREDFGWEGGVKMLLTENYLCAVSKFKFEMKSLPSMGRIDYQTDSYFRAFLDNWWENTFDNPPNILMQVSNIDLCKEMVFSGVGYGLLPSIVLSDHPEVYQIPLCDERGKRILRRTYLVAKESVKDCRAQKAFYDFISASDFNSFLRRY